MRFSEHGDVAQPGERLVRNEEVTGSSPVISTICLLPEELPGCSSFPLAGGFLLAKAFLVWYPEAQEVLGIRRTVSLGAVGFLAGLGVVLHMVEGCLPPPVPLPGIKVGLANVVTLVALFLFGGREALYVVLVRIVLGNLFSGTLLGIAFFLSLGGGLTSFGIMSALRQKNVSPLWTSLLGAVFHNLGQWVVASLYVQSGALLFYLPVLLLWAVPAGFGVGYLGMLLVKSEALRRKTGSEPVPPREGLGIDGLARH